MRDWADQPEASGPLSESDLGRAQYGDPGMPSIGRIYPPDAYPAGRSSERSELPPDPALAAVERTRRAEAAADAAKTVPADALVVP